MNALTKSAAVAARSARPVAQRGQKRNIVDWMTNYPDKVRKLFQTTVDYWLTLCTCNCAN